MRYLQKLPWAVFGISIIITMLVWTSFLNYESQLQESKFNSKTTEMTHSILDRLEQYEQVLIGAHGLFSASAEVTPEEWKSFVDIQLITRYQDIQGIAYLKHITSEEEADNLVTQMHNYGFDDFTIKPEGKRSEYYPVVYLEPLDFRNERAIGYDIYSEDKRRAAVNLAKETGQTTLSEKIILVQETGEDTQNGFLLMVPIYSNEKNSSAENDSSSLLGIVDAVFRINNFVDALLGKETFKDIHMRIYDGSVKPENLFFDSNDFFEYKESRIDFSSVSNIEFANKNWILVFNGVSSQYSQIDEIISMISIPIVGISMSFLGFYAFTLFNKNLQLSKTTIQYEELKKTNKQKDEFLGILSHELRTPLVPIKGVCKILLDKDYTEKLSEEQKKLIQTIVSNSQRLDAMIDKLLLIQKLEFGRYDYQMKNLNIKDFMNDINISYSSIMLEKQVEFVNSVKDGTAIYGDKNAIHQIFDNLINNALDFVAKENPRIEIGTETQNGKTVFFVKDNGVGIASEQQEKIFNKFYQVDSSISREHGGFGIGLAICKKLVTEMGGTIWVVSQEGKGTSFYFTLKEADKN